MVVNVAKGIAGVQYGARPVPTDGLDLHDVTEVAVAWLDQFFGTFHREVSDRETYLASSSAVLSAIGAMGNAILAVPDWQRGSTSERLLNSLRDVDWHKGEHWQGIAGRFTPKGVFSVSGTKEVGYAVFNALADPANPSYSTVRRSPHAESSVETAAAAATGPWTPAAR
jgi:DNA sulfur modification protein DndB